MVDGAIYKEEVESLKIQAVPAVYADGELLHVGRGEFGTLLTNLEEKYGVVEKETTDSEIRRFDVLVVGGGPAGASAAIYSARKGLNVAVLAQTVGGQVKETTGIENMISVPQTTGEKLTVDLRKHMEEYPISILEHRIVEKVEVDGNEKIVHVKGGERFATGALIIATGANWKKLNVPGEADHIGKGVAFCVHCDGPFYKDKHVAVIGGGNSGIEAAIDLAAICSKVTVFEFLDELKADKVLQEKVASLPNVELDIFEGLGRTKVNEVNSGDICALIGIEGFEIGDTITDIDKPEPLDPIAIDEPTMSMLFTINNSPFFGQDGKYVTSRHIYERLMRELDKNLALRVEETESSDSWIVYGRGVLHLSVLIETMRREGYELQVGQPQVIIKEKHGEKHEPVEQLTINLPEEYSSKIIDVVTRRKGELLTMESKGDRMHMEFVIPSRGIIGLNNIVLTLSAGEAIMAHRFLEFQPWKGEIEKRQNGSIIAGESGNAYAYALDKLQDRGHFFIYPQTDVYAGQVVGEQNKEGDLVVNVTKSKKLTNVRASGSDDKAQLAPPVIFSLEEALEYIKDDEYVEVTPKHMRIRKILLDENDRKRASKKS
jgi:thioredoxin reductase